MMKSAYGLAFAASVFCLPVWAGTAYAQDEAPAPKSGNSAEVEDIVVTANRREQNLQAVPIAVTAVTAQSAELRGVTGTAALPSLAPSLNITQNGNSAAIFLRGVGFFGGSPNDEPSVAIYVDGVYMPTASANFFSFNNIERLEVLKGPQGTLFGRNATAGVIQIVTRTPTYTPTVEATAGYSNYNTIFGSLYASAGLSDKVAIDIAAQGLDQSKGWGKNLTTGSDSFTQSNWSVRSKLLWEPTEDIRVILAGDFNRSLTPGVSPQPAPGASTLIGQPYPGRFNIYGNDEDYSLVENYGGSLRIEYDAGPVKLTSITAYRKTDSFFLLDQDSSPLRVVRAEIQSFNREITQEFQVSNGAGSSFDWLVGAYLYDYRAKYDRLALRSDVDPGTNFDILAGQNSKSMAVFGQATFPVTDTTNLTAGLRYTTEDQKHFNTFYLPNSPIAILGPDRRRQSFEKFTWRISVDQKLGPDILAYASFNRGFKSGGFSLVVPPGAIPPYKPEVLDAYEVGLKSTLFDRKLRLNLSGFYYDYTNIQFQQIQPGVAFILNGPEAKVYGFEAEAQARITPNFNLFASMSYLHARYGDFPNAPRFDRVGPNGITPPACVGAGTPAVPGTNCSVFGFNADGNRLIYAPDWTFTIGGDYTIETSVGNFTLASSIYYNDGSYASPDNRLRNPSYYLLNGSIGWTSENGHYGVQLFGRNLLNEYYYQVAIPQGAPFGDIIAGAEPRTYGVKLTVKY